MIERCKVCGGVLVYMGRLGMFYWYKCHDCGLECNGSKPNNKEESYDDCNH